MNRKNRIGQIIQYLDQQEHVFINKTIVQDKYVAQQNIEQQIKAYWEDEIYTAEEIKERFELPSDYLGFLEKMIDCQGFFRKSPKTLCLLSNWKIVIESTIEAYDDFFFRQSKSELVTTNYPTMLLQIGGWSAKKSIYFIYISCDKSYHFGEIFEVKVTYHCLDIMAKTASRIWSDFSTFLEQEF